MFNVDHDGFQKKVISKRKQKYSSSSTSSKNLNLAIESIQHGLKASYIWDFDDIPPHETETVVEHLTTTNKASKNCHHIYSRLFKHQQKNNHKLKIESKKISGSNRQNYSFKDVDHDDVEETIISVVEFVIIAKNNNKEPTKSSQMIVGGYTFFGNIPQMIQNINSVLVELDMLLLEDDCSLCKQPNQHSNNKNIHCNSRTVNGLRYGFIDVSATLTSPKLINKNIIHNINHHHHHHLEDNLNIMENHNHKINIITEKIKNTTTTITRSSNSRTVYNSSSTSSMLYRKYSLLHIRDYLGQNVNERCLTIRMRPFSVEHDDDDDGRNDSQKIMQQKPGTLNLEKDILELDLCFISGVLLGYPVIYCNETIDQGNCLSYKTLCHYSIIINDQKSFKNYQLYSFSIPLEFQSTYQPFVQRWFQRLKTNHSPRFQFQMLQTLENHPLILT